MRCNRVLVGLALELRRLDLPAFTREVVRRTREVLGVEFCRVLEFRVDEEPRPDPVVTESREPCFGWTALSREHGLVSGISAVIQASGRTSGILSACSTSRRCYSREEAAFLRDIAELLGIAMERALEERHRAGALARRTALVVANTLKVPCSSEKTVYSAPGRESGLTPRQLEVLRLLDSGMRARQIKAELSLSEPTVRTHIRAILRAFGACSQLEALHRARTLGLIDGKSTSSHQFR
jgi:DNA-binding CsgD family transcriptional regulator